MALQRARRGRRRLMSEINVVPYIDVMLVLLVIFMVTAPLLTQGIEIELPEAAGTPVDETPDKALMVDVDARGRYAVEGQRVSSAELARRAKVILGKRPRTPVLVRGDRHVDYGEVVKVMALLKDAGAETVGLMTEPPPTRPDGG